MKQSKTVTRNPETGNRQLKDKGLRKIKNIKTDTMKIYNSLTNKKEEFVPLIENEVKIYACGPTVYDEPHIGHARSAFIFDVIKRYFKYKGFKVLFVRNVTDVDDKIIAKAQAEFPELELNDAVSKVSSKYLDSYHNAMERLGITLSEGDKEPRATEYIRKMQDFISDLIQKKAAYEVDGDVYFDISSFGDYGKLSNQNLDKMKEGARIHPGEKKKNALDFALWKKTKEGEPSWDSPWGKGRPGWHIECSVMSSDILGDEFDIHGGGIDLIFPHHENEVAQSQAAGKKFAKYWIHHGLLTIEEQKMSKSLGNFKTIDEVVKDLPESAAADILKVFFLRVHYSKSVNFSKETIQDAKEATHRILRVLEGDYAITAIDEEYVKEVNFHKDLFMQSMDDNFNTAKALADIFGIVRYCSFLKGKQEKDNKKVESAIRYAQNTIRELGKVLGLELNELDIHDPLWGKLGAFIISKEEVENKIELRTELRKQKKFAEADSIRKELEDKGILLKDAPQGTTWEIG
ncbi:MAG: cysteine--tRNA ligase [Candidatus Omnitrophota bacterium]